MNSERIIKQLDEIEPAHTELVSVIRALVSGQAALERRVSLLEKAAKAPAGEKPAKAPAGESAAAPAPAPAESAADSSATK